MSAPNLPETQQLEFADDVIKRFGYDFERGRRDKTHHPFMTKFSIGDVRITIRTKDDDLSEGLFSMTHEAGHALYEQGTCTDFEGLSLDGGASSGVHESQSRLWENVVGEVGVSGIFSTLNSNLPFQTSLECADRYFLPCD